MVLTFFVWEKSEIKKKNGNIYKQMIFWIVEDRELLRTHIYMTWIPKTCMYNCKWVHEGMTFQWTKGVLKEKNYPNSLIIDKGIENTKVIPMTERRSSAHRERKNVFRLLTLITHTSMTCQIKRHKTNLPVLLKKI